LAHESLLYPNLTLKENLVFAARMYNVRRPEERADRWIEKLGLSLYADRQPHQVSRGMRQRLSVARALLHDPPILLWDEPWSGLDAQWAEWLSGLVRDLRSRGKAIFLTTHNWARARSLAQRMLLLEDGQIEELDRGGLMSASCRGRAA
jgi:ABC-type multidrug transport system ATPase subunit